MNQEKKIIPTANITSSTDLKGLFQEISSFYRNAEIVGYFVVFGGWISAALLVTATFNVFTLEKYEFISLTVLSAVFIICGCILFGYLEHLKLKWYIAKKDEGKTNA